MFKVFKQPRMVSILWNDHKGIDYLVGLVEDELMPLMRPMEVTSVGWLVAEDDDGYLLAEEVHRDGEDPVQVRDLTFILKVNVKEIHRKAGSRRKRESATSVAGTASVSPTTTDSSKNKVESVVSVETPRSD